MSVQPCGSFRALQHRFDLRAEPPLDAWLRRALAPLSAPPSPEDVEVEIERDGPETWAMRVSGSPVAQGVHARQVLNRFLVDMNHRVASSTTEHLVIHAGVVEAPQGVILLAAPSGSGKSTMVAEAARRGWRYGGDEHAALHLETGLVDPVPKPIGLKTGSASRFAELGDPAPAIAPFLSSQLFVAPTDLPGGWLGEPHRVALVVIPHYDSSSTDVRIDRLSAAAGVMALRANAFNFSRDPVASLRAMSDLMRRSAAIRVCHGDAASALTALVDYGA